MVLVIDREIDVMHVKIHGIAEKKHHQQRQPQGQAEGKGVPHDMPHFLMGDGKGPLSVKGADHFSSPRKAFFTTKAPRHQERRS